MSYIRPTRRRSWWHAINDSAGLIGTAILVVGPPTAVRAAVVKVLWAAYIVPWFGVRPMPYVIAFGIVLIATVMRPPNTDNLRCSILELYVRGLTENTAILTVGFAGLLFT